MGSQVDVETFRDELAAAVKKLLPLARRMPPGTRVAQPKGLMTVR